METLHITTLGALLLTPSERFLATTNFGEKSLEDLQEAVREYLDSRNSWDGVVDTGFSLGEFLRILCELSGQSNVAQAVLLGRIERSATFLELSRQYGHSEERIRQILKRAIDGIEQHYRSRAAVDLLRSRIADILDQFRGLVGRDELATELVQHMSWTHSVSAECLNTLFGALLPYGDYLLEEDAVSRNHACRECDDIAQRLHLVFDDHKAEILPISALAQLMTPCTTSMDKKCPSLDPLSFSEPFVRELAIRAGLLCDENNVYSEVGWTLYNGNRSEQVDAYLKLLGTVASPHDVWMNLCPYLDDFASPENICDILVKMDSAVEWGKREFLHVDYVPSEGRLLSLLHHALSARLRDIPYVAAHDVFDEMRAALVEAGIPNEYALCSVVRLCLDDMYVDSHRNVHSST